MLQPILINMISVIIPVFKVENYLDECIESVVNQTYSDIEILLIDDGSPDLCPQICDQWAKKDSRIKVIHKENGGLSDARNVGIDIAKGDYISFLDSDDYMAKDCLKNLHNALNNHPDCVISSCSHWLDKDGIISLPFCISWTFDNIRFIEPEDYAEKMLLMKSQHTAWGKLFKSEALQNIRYRKGCINEDILFALDYYPIVEKMHYRIVEIPDQLIYYRQREGSICHNKNIPFYIAISKNRKIVMKATKGKKKKVYDEYKKKYLHDLVSILSYKLNNLKTSYIRFYSTCRELWLFSNSYARKELNDPEYATFIHCKYFAPLMKLKYSTRR